MDIDPIIITKSNARKEAISILQVKVPTKLKKVIEKLSEQAGFSQNTYVRILLEAAASGKVAVRSEVYKAEKTA